ncbi:MAG: O-antigen ligase family protein [Aestuariivirga sp.]
MTWDFQAAPSMPARQVSTSQLERLEFALAAVAVFLSPMNFLRHPVVFVTLSDVFALLCLAVMFVRRAVPLRPLGSYTPMWMAGAMFVFGGLLTSSAVFGDPNRGMIVALQYFYSLVVLPLIIAGRPIPQTVSLAKIFLLSIFLMCIFGIYLIEYDGQTNTRFVSGSRRMQSFVERENECASLIALTFPLLFWLRSQGHLSLVAAAVSVAAMFYGVLLTGSNTGLLALLGACYIYFAAKISLRSLTFGTIGLAGAAFIVISRGKDVLPAVFQKRVLPALESGDISQAGTATERLALIYESLDVAQRTALLGIGADQYRLQSHLNQVVHNSYLLIWSEGGLIGLAGLLLILLTGFCLAGAANWVGKNKDAGLCALTTFLVFALTINAVPHIYARFWYVPLLLSAGIAVAALRPAMPPARGGR